MISYKLDVSGSIPGRDKCVSVLHPVCKWVWGPPVSHPNGTYIVICSGERRRKIEASQLPPCRTKIKSSRTFALFPVRLNVLVLNVLVINQR